MTCLGLATKHSLHLDKFTQSASAAPEKQPDSACFLLDVKLIKEWYY